MITIKQIAVLAGTSRGTVDRALKGRPGVSAETKERIEKICREHHYMPNRAGVMLGLKHKQFRIGAVLPSLGTSRYEDFIAGLERAEQLFEDYGVRIELYELGESGAESIAAMDRLISSGIQALILAPVPDERLERKAESVREGGLFVVSAGNPQFPCDASVCCNPERFARQAGELAAFAGKSVALVENGTACGDGESFFRGFSQGLGPARCVLREEDRGNDLSLADRIAESGAEVLVCGAATAENLGSRLNPELAVVVLGTDSGTGKLLLRDRTVALSENGREQGELAVRIAVEALIMRSDSEKKREVLPRIVGREIALAEDVAVDSVDTEGVS